MEKVTGGSSRSWIQRGVHASQSGWTIELAGAIGFRRSLKVRLPLPSPSVYTYGLDSPPKRLRFEASKACSLGIDRSVLRPDRPTPSLDFGLLGARGSQLATGSTLPGAQAPWMYRYKPSDPVLSRSVTHHASRPG